jgi:hypothetical protein
MRMTLAVAGWLVLGLAFGLVPALADAATAQSDPLSFPEARVIATDELSAGEETRVIISQVSEVGDRLRFSDALVVPAEGRRQLLQVPSGFTPQSVLEHYQEALLARNARILFSCEGRGCGRSAVWANRVFDQSRLYGQDSDQAYVVGAWRDDQNQLRLLSVYLVQRGNRSISVLEQELTLPEDYRLPGSNPRERQVLGPFVIPFETGAVPRLSLGSQTGSDIRNLTERYPEAVIYLTGFAPPSPGGPEAAMDQAGLALEAARRLLEGNGVAADRQVLIAVGAAVPVADPQRQGPRVEVTIVRRSLGADE